ncbi:proton-coupled amino acid transporter-like protein CG1139 [Ischnura elegans]|uniref:proton-coupled amino acid transporter-like protein CG1139 n=1 Tax=Ischnura elegans TaxID=197161 RepID=UPI001ED89A04|nr:proton-coupled amino acid transporter-like protein CG1139 [Ischnura elegans]
MKGYVSESSLRADGEFAGRDNPIFDDSESGNIGIRDIGNLNSPSNQDLTPSTFDADYRVNDTSAADEHADNNSDYNPFEHRHVERTNSDLGGLAHLLKSSLGTGILAMPNAFRSGGLLFGTIATLLVGYICTHCVYILVDSSHTLCRRLRVPSLTYAETAEAAFKTGPFALRRYSSAVRRFVDISLAITYYSAACVYIVFIAHSTKQVADLHSGMDIDVRLYIAALLPPLLALGAIRDLKLLVPFSAAANVCIVLSFAFTLFYVFREAPDLASRRLQPPSLGQLPLFFATVIFAMEGIGVVMPVENSMRTPQHFLSCPGVLCVAMTTVVTLYTTIGFFGYAKYGDETLGSITLNLPTEEPLAQAVKVLIAVAILFTYGLQFYVPTEITWRLIRPSIPEKRLLSSEYAVRLIAVCLTVIVAASVPHLGPIISLVGALFFSTLGLIIPATVDAVTALQPTGAAAAPGRHRRAAKLVKDALIVAFAAMALLAGSYASIREMQDSAGK